MNSLFYRSQCASTQDEIFHYFSAKNPVPTAVYTFNQTKGKGQYGNSWESGAGLNLAYSLAVPVDRATLPAHLFNFRTAQLLAEFVANLTLAPAAIKWPNDLIIKDKKVSGLLIERRTLDAVPCYIVGIGLNVLQTNFDNLPKAASLFTQTGLKPDLKSLTGDLHNWLSENLLQPVPAEEVLRHINASLYRKDVISVFEIKNIRQNGIIRSVEADGRLCVELEEDGLSHFSHKELEMLY